MIKTKTKAKASTAGITLIALVITIIVLLILAGVGISMLSGENGILRQAATAKERTEESAEQEELNLLMQELLIARKQGKDIEEYMINNNRYNIINNSDYKEGTYILEDNELNKKYILDENLQTTEATEIITILLKVKTYVSENTDFKNTMQQLTTSKLQENDNQLNSIIGGGYDNSKYSFVIFNRRLLCYPNNNVTDEVRNKCEKIGLYLWGDINGDLVVDDYDSQYLKENTQKINSTSNNRTWYVADLAYSTTKTINNEDATILSNWVNNDSYLYNTYLNHITEIYTEYEQALNAKLQQGVVKADFNATTDEQVKEYMPSYIQDKWKFRILRGNLLCIVSPVMTDFKLTICQSESDDKTVPPIYLLGDLNIDNKITSSDKRILNQMLSPDYEWDEETKELEIMVADVNVDGILDSNDMEVLEQMIDGIYEY